MEDQEVWINNQEITFSKFLLDLIFSEREPGENYDIVKECKAAGGFGWGEQSEATNSLALACCFYLKLKWVTCRFFLKEFAKAKQADLRLHFNDDQLEKGYQYSEDIFAKEFGDFMGELGAILIDENDQRN